MDDSRGDEGQAQQPRIKCFSKFYYTFATETSAHGFRWTVGCQDKLRITFWTLLILFAGMAATFSVYSVTRDYVIGPRFSTEYNLISVSNILQKDHETSLKKKGVDMPNIILCAPNPWSEHKIRMHNISFQLVSYMTYLLYPFGVNPVLYKSRSKMIQLETQFNDTLDRFGGDLRILLDNITVSCDEFIVFCKKGLDHVMSGRRCCKEIFNERGIFTNDGKCFTSQGRLNYVVAFPAKANGVSVTLKGHQHGYGNMLDKSIYNWLLMSRDGVSFAVTDNDTHPTIDMIQRGQGAKMNSVTDVAIHRRTIDFSDSKTGSDWFRKPACIEDHSDGGSRFVPGFKHFSIENCKLALFQKAANHFRGCNLVTIPIRDPYLGYCTPLQSILLFKASWKRPDLDQEDMELEKHWIKHLFMEDSKSNISDALNETVHQQFLDLSKPFKDPLTYRSSRCPRDCSQTYFRAVTSSYQLSKTFLSTLSEKYGSVMNVNEDDSFDFATLEFYYPSFDFTRIVQHRRGPLEWLADIGGSLGLYLGASVFTIAEIFWFFCSTLWLVAIGRWRGGSV